MTDLADYWPPAEPREAFTPRRCRHPRSYRRPLEGGGSVCSSCGREIAAGVSRRSKNNRLRGKSDELEVAALLGGRRMGPLNLPWDVTVEGYLRVQCKRVDRWPALNRVIEWLDAIPQGAELRAVTIADTPGPGHKTRRLIVMDTAEFARWHGVAK